MSGFLRWIFGRKSKNPMLKLARDPAYVRSTNELLATKQQALQSPLLPKKRLRKLTDQLLRESGRFGIPAATLGSQGSHAESALLETLRDPRFIIADAASDHSLDDRPIITVLDLLGDCGTPQSEPDLWRLTQSTDDEVREKAIRSLTQIACESSARRLAERLEAMNTEDRRCIFKGVRNRLYNRGPADWERRVFTEMALPYTEADSEVYDEAIEALTAAHADHAGKLLNERFHDGSPKDRSSAARLMDRLKIAFVPRDLTSPFAGIDDQLDLAIALKLCAGDLRIPGWENVWSDEISRQPPTATKFSGSLWADSLLDAIAIRLGHDSVFGAVQMSIDLDELAQPIADVRVLLDLDSQVCNGGWLQYFVNSTGPNWRLALSAAERVGASHTHEVLGQAADEIGLDSSDTTRDRINGKLRHLSQTTESALGELNSSYYNHSEQIKQILARFIADHRAHFKPERQAPLS